MEETLSIREMEGSVLAGFPQAMFPVRLTTLLSQFPELTQEVTASNCPPKLTVIWEDS